MKVARSILLAFIVGGAFSIVGQGFSLLWLEVLGSESLFLGFAILVSMGVVGALMFIFGINQPLEKEAGFGVMLPFNGLCAAIAGVYAQGRSSGARIGSSIAASLKMIGTILGIGCALILVVALVFVVIQGG